MEGFDPDSLSLAAEEHRKAYESSRLEMICGYAETHDCRRRYLLNYFGEEYEAECCGWCDNDVRVEAEHEVTVQEDREKVETPFSVGDRVAHPERGEGRVYTGWTEDSVTVLFEEAGGSSVR